MAGLAFMGVLTSHMFSLPEPLFHRKGTSITKCVFPDTASSVGGHIYIGTEKNVCFL